MDIWTKGNLAFALLIIIFVGCGGSGGGLSVQDIPRYPNASEGESMEQSAFGGLMSSSLVQFTTTDSYDKVVEFYTDALKIYKTEVMTHTSELGRQTAISIPQKKRMISVAIQEFTKEGKVNITLMGVGR